MNVWIDITPLTTAVLMRFGLKFSTCKDTILWYNSSQSGPSKRRPVEGAEGVAKKKSGTDKPGSSQIALKYPKHAFSPEDLLDFIELPQFTARWEKLDLDDENDLCMLQLFVMADPKGSPPIEGTNGIRKFRFAPARWNVGKSGAARVLYVYFEEFGVVLLCLIYGKGEIDNISRAVKRYLNRLVAEVEAELRRLKTLQ